MSPHCGIVGVSVSGPACSNSEGEFVAGGASIGIRRHDQIGAEVAGCDTWNRIGATGRTRDRRSV